MNYCHIIEDFKNYTFCGLLGTCPAITMTILKTLLTRFLLLNGNVKICGNYTTEITDKNVFWVIKMLIILVNFLITLCFYLANRVHLDN